MEALKPSSYALLSVILVASTMILLPLAVVQDVQARPLATRTFWLVGSASSGWNQTAPNPQPTVTVHENDSVVINLNSIDRLPHAFFVDVDNNGAHTAGEPLSGTSTSASFISYTFEATFGAGTYTYYCQFHPSSMQGRFVVKLLGDVDGDCDVDIFDATRLGRAFDSVPGDQRWEPRADFNNNGKIDIFDAVILSRNFDRRCPPGV